MARLVVKTGPHRGMSFELTGDRVSLGRDFSNHIQLPDAKASRHHAEIRLEESGWTAWDLGSSNGTCVNGKQMKREVLGDGDEIRIGGTVMEFTSDEARRAPTLERAETASEFGRMETLAVERNRFLSGEIQLLAGPGDDVLISLGGESAHDGRAHEATVPGNEYLARLIHLVFRYWTSRGARPGVFFHCGPGPDRVRPSCERVP